MKAVIAVDSIFGNTRLVGEALKEEIEKAGNEVEFVNLRTDFRVPSDGDILLIGSPTRVGKMTGRSKKFVRKLDTKAWSGKTVVIFDTHMPLPEDPDERRKKTKWIMPGAAGKLNELIAKRGLKVHSPSLRCKVSDMKGPLMQGELDRAREYAKQLLAPVH